MAESLVAAGFNTPKYCTNALSDEADSYVVFIAAV